MTHNLLITLYKQCLQIKIRACKRHSVRPKSIIIYESNWGMKWEGDLGNIWIRRLWVKLSGNNQINRDSRMNLLIILTEAHEY